MIIRGGLTVWQPYANAIARTPARRGKRIENRKRAPWDCVLQPDTWIALHASMRRPRALEVADVDRRMAAASCGKGVMLEGAAGPLGAVLAVCQVAGYILPKRGGAVVARPTREVQAAVLRVLSGEDPWYDGGFGWILSNVVPLWEPVPCAGRQGLWRLPGAVAEAVLDRARNRPVFGGGEDPWGEFMDPIRSRAESESYLVLLASGAAVPYSRRV